MKIIIANLKMNLLLNDIKNYKKKLENINFLNEIVVCPSSLFLPYLISNKYSLGSQNVFYEKEGSFTGEISIEQLKSINVKYIILGHSERREYFNETNFIINKKIKAVLSNNLIPIVCIGEEKQIKSNNKKHKIIKKQINECFKDVIDFNNIVIAYEPIWAIGSGITPLKEELKEMITYIKELVKKEYNSNVKVIYGGSINLNNIYEINSIENNDGFLIGSSSTNIDEFISIINKIN